MLSEIEIVKNGDMVSSNLGSFIPGLRKVLDKQISAELKTDEDVAKQREFVKNVKETRQRLKNKVVEIESGFSSLFEFKQQAKEADSILRSIQSHGERLLKSAREVRKKEIISQANIELQKKIKEMEDEIGYRIEVSYDLEAATHRKKTIASINEAVEKAAQDALLQAQHKANTAKQNLDFLKKKAGGFMFLFNDLANLVFMPINAFQSTAISRIEQHKTVEKAKAEAEAQRIKAQTAQKEAELKAQMEKEKEKLRESLEKEIKEKITSAQTKQKEHKAKPAVNPVSPVVVEPVKYSPQQHKKELPGDLKCDLVVFSRRAGLTDEQYEELIQILEPYFS